MHEDLYKILCENDLDETLGITALVSRDICCVADFLENGEAALKDMKDMQMQCSEEWSSIANCYSWEFPEYRDDDIDDAQDIDVDPRDPACQEIK
jgi:hypothetical protein